MKVIKITQSISEAIFWLVLSGFISLLLLQYLSNSSYFPSILNFKTFVVRSGSMEPTIMTGDMIFVRPSRNYSVDSVISFFDPAGTLITHRIIDSKLNENNEIVFTTQGDNNQSPDVHPVQIGAIVGKWWFSIPFIGYALVYAHTPLGVSIITSIIVGLIICDFLWDYMNKHWVKKNE